MCNRVFTLLLSLSVTLQNVCTGFHVWTLVEYNNNDKNSVNIICQHNAAEGFVMNAELFINGSKAATEGREEGNQFNFTLQRTAEHKRQRYYCRVYNRSPFPILIRIGNEIELFSGFEECDIESTKPTNSSSCLDTQAPLLSLLTWGVLGIVLLLFLYSLIITVVYIKLRKKISEELTITYVPMQKNRVRPKMKVKAHGGDKNAEYMDMREVHPQAQPIRDMNHNSRLHPVGFTV